MQLEDREMQRSRYPHLRYRRDRRIELASEFPFASGVDECRMLRVTNNGDKSTRIEFDEKCDDCEDETYHLQHFLIVEER